MNPFKRAINGARQAARTDPANPIEMAVNYAVQIHHDWD